MINVEQCWSVLNIVGQCWSMLTVLINVHECWPVLISVDQCWSMLTIGDQYRSVLFNVDVDERWSRLINVNQWWTMMANVDQCWSMLTNIDQCCSEQQNHWTIIDCLMISKVFDVWGGWKVMKIAKIKEKAAENLQKSSSGARISRNSGVGDSPNSPQAGGKESLGMVFWCLQGPRSSSMGRRGV